MTCPLCNDTGEQRYWEGRWRDAQAEIERLRAALREIAQGHWTDIDGRQYCTREAGIARDALINPEGPSEQNQCDRA